MKAKVKPARTFAISNCNINMEATKPNGDAVEAVRQIAIACGENAKALTKAAEALVGAPDHRIGISVSGTA